MKTPGTLRIFIGSFSVVLLLILALFGKFFTKYGAQDLDTDWIMEPPSSSFFSSWLITKKGLENLGKLPTTSKSGEKQDPENAIVQEDTASISNTSDVNEATEDEFAFLESEAKTLPATELSTDRTESPGTKQQDVSELANAETKKDVEKHSHWLGTDNNGRDMLALIVAGARNCILPGLLACLVALGIGIPLGISGGYYGGKWSGFIQFINSVLLSFPRFVLILVVICALEPNVYYTMIVLGLCIVPSVSEIFKNRVQTLSKMGFILAAKESGLRDFRIMAKHLFWYQSRTVFAIQASLIMAESILVETTLSYLQFGTKAPDVSWGNIIEGSRMAFFSEYYWITFFPAVAIVFAILGFFYLADGLNARLEYIEKQ